MIEVAPEVGVLRPWLGDGIELPRSPHTKEDRRQGPPGDLLRPEAEEKQERIAEADLREGVLEGEVGHRPAHRAQEDPERHK